MLNKQTTKRPNALRLVLINLLAGVIIIGVGGGLLVVQEKELLGPRWPAYPLILIGILIVITAALIVMYKRVGLLLGIGVYIVSLVGISIFLPIEVGCKTAFITLAVVMIYQFSTYLTDTEKRLFFT
jgi:hypothetical protein